MKAQLTFDLPDERQAFTDAQNGTQWRAVVQEMDNALRDTAKHDSRAMQRKAAWQWREMLNHLCQNRNLNIFD